MDHLPAVNIHHISALSGSVSTHALFSGRSRKSSHFTSAFSSAPSACGDVIIDIAAWTSTFEDIWPVGK